MMPDIEPIVRRRNRLRHQHKVVCLHWWGRLQPANARWRALILAFLLLAWPLCADQSGTEQGIHAFQQGRYVEACRLLQDAVTHDPSDEHARAFLALARAAGGHCAEAMEELTARFHSSANPDLARHSGIECPPQVKLPHHYPGFAKTE